MGSSIHTGFSLSQLFPLLPLTLKSILHNFQFSPIEQNNYLSPENSTRMTQIRQIETDNKLCFLTLFILSTIFIIPRLTLGQVCANLLA